MVCIKSSTLGKGLASSLEVLMITLRGPRPTFFGALTKCCFSRVYICHWDIAYWALLVLYFRGCFSNSSDSDEMYWLLRFVADWSILWAMSLTVNYSKCERFSSWRRCIELFTVIAVSEKLHRKICRERRRMMMLMQIANKCRRQKFSRDMRRCLWDGAFCFYNLKLLCPRYISQKQQCHSNHMGCPRGEIPQ